MQLICRTEEDWHPDTSSLNAMHSRFILYIWFMVVGSGVWTPLCLHLQSGYQWLQCSPSFLLLHPSHVTTSFYAPAAT